MQSVARERMERLDWAHRFRSQVGPGFGSKSSAPSRPLCHGGLDARVVSETNTDPAVSICCELAAGQTWRLDQDRAPEGGGRSSAGTRPRRTETHRKGPDWTAVLTVTSEAAQLSCERPHESNVNDSCVHNTLQ